MANKHITHKHPLTASQYAYLHELGLSKDAIELYELMVRHTSLTAHASSMLRHTHASAEYRLFYELEKFGMVRRNSSRPRVFEAASLKTGMQAAFVHKSTELKQLLGVGGDLSGVGPELLLGRQALYRRYYELAEIAQHEIWVYAIGIAYSKELEALQRRLMKRGISFHHIVQQVRPENFHIIRKWQRLGMRLKYLRGDRGFHVTIFDESRIIITFSNPGNTEDRLSIVTDNPQAVRMFRTQFGLLWQEAQPLEVPSPSP